MARLISVKTSASFFTPLILKSGVVLPSFDLVYECYGKLNDSKSNAVLICPSIFTNHHVAGCYSEDPKNIGWWDHMVGSGKPIDTDKYFVVGLENIGGCHGSTGPSSVNPHTGSPYRDTFPCITVEDWVISQSMLADKLGINQFAAVVGCGYAGLQAIQWSIAFPERVGRVCVIASGPSLPDKSIAIHYIARKAILNDRNFNWDNYSKYGQTDVRGLQVAMMLEYVEALTDDKLDETFARELIHDDLPYNVLEPDFQVESYLQYVAYPANFFDPRSYLFMSKACDYYDAYENIHVNADEQSYQDRPEYLFVSFPEDQMFGVKRTSEFVKYLKVGVRNVFYSELNSEFGNSSYLRTPLSSLEDLLRKYFQEIYN